MELTVKRQIWDPLVDLYLKRIITNAGYDANIFKFKGGEKHSTSKTQYDDIKQIAIDFKLEAEKLISSQIRQVQSNLMLTVINRYFYITE